MFLITFSIYRNYKEMIYVSRAFLYLLEVMVSNVIDLRSTANFFMFNRLL